MSAICGRLRPYHVLLLPLGLLISGGLSTISTKAADKRGFDHPFVQAFCMFIGEMLCLVPSYVWPLEGGSAFPVTLFFPPAFLDVFSASLMFGGLRLTNASTYQMLRASVVPFTGAMSYVVLGRRPLRYQWAGMALILLGALLVGFASRLDPDADSDAKNPMLGNSMVLLGQVAVAAQLVWEERIFSAHKIAPMRAVGLEGVFGGLLMSVLLIVFSQIPDDSRPGGKFESVSDAMDDLEHDGVLVLLTLLAMLSVAGVNYFGISVTQQFSASHRTVIDTLRTLLVWIFSLAIGWETSVSFLQVFGFFLLLLGTLVFNAVLRVPALFDYLGRDEQLAEPLLA